MAMSDAFTAEILKPYRAHAKYLKSAEIRTAATISESQLAVAAPAAE
jgi:hypothetical protein